MLCSYHSEGASPFISVPITPGALHCVALFLPLPGRLILLLCCCQSGVCLTFLPCSCRSKGASPSVSPCSCRSKGASPFCPVPVGLRAPHLFALFLPVSKCELALQEFGPLQIDLLGGVHQPLHVQVTVQLHADRRPLLVVTTEPARQVLLQHLSYTVPTGLIPFTPDAYRSHWIAPFYADTRRSHWIASFYP